MKYRESITLKLDRIDTLVNKSFMLLNRNERVELENTLKTIKEINEDITSYISREPLSPAELALR